MEDLFRWLNKPERAAYLFILPAMSFIVVFTVIPLVAALVISTLKMDIFLQTIRFAGLDNFQKLLGDERFWNALKNTVCFTVIEMPLQIMIALIAAVYVARNTLFRKFLRSVFFVPFICSLTAIGIIWSFLLDPQTGIVTHYLHQLGFPRLSFFHDPQLAMPSVILITVWRNFGYSMVILVAGIQSIPQTYYEAARMDGAGPVKQFFNITLPMLIPALNFCVIIQTIQALQVFDQIFVTTKGGPLHATDTMVNYIYNTGFATAPFDLGYASAMSVVLLVIIMVTTLSMHRYFLKREEFVR